MGEATHWGDGLLGKVVLGGGVVDDLLAILDVNTLPNSVDLLVHLCSVVETLLTRSRNGELHTGRMPSTNTSNLSQTLVRLTGQLLGVPSGSDTFEEEKNSN